MLLECRGEVRERGDEILVHGEPAALDGESRGSLRWGVGGGERGEGKIDGRQVKGGVGGASGGWGGLFGSEEELSGSSLQEKWALLFSNYSLCVQQKILKKPVVCEMTR